MAVTLLCDQTGDGPMRFPWRVALVDFDQTLYELFPDRKAELPRIRAAAFEEWAKAEACRSGTAITAVDDPYPTVADPYEWWYALAQSRARDEAKPMAILDSWFDSLEECQLRSGHFLPGAEEFLMGLQASQVGIAIVSSNSAAVIRTALSGLAIQHDHFEVVGRPNPLDRDKMKPEAWPISRALALLGGESDLGSSAMVGDSIVDVQAALRAGCTPVCVSTGSYSARELVEAGAAFVYPDLMSLLLEQTTNR